VTERLYYDDCYARSFEATVVENDPGSNRVVLDRTAFYPTSGGQPFDLGTINGIAVVSVQEDEEAGDIQHKLASPLTSETTVNAEIDWTRRFDHMQQHTGQHLLSAVFHDLFGLTTVSFHMGPAVSTIELTTPSLDHAAITAAEQRANEIIAENRPVSITFEDAAAVEGLRKASARSGTLRIISIEGLDRSACGGTHLRSTGEIGSILLRSTEKIRGNTRIEFVCGLRAVARARSEYALLSSIAALTGTAIDAAPGVVATWSERLADAEKRNRKSALELARYYALDRYNGTYPNANGRRIHIQRIDDAGIPEDIRAEAQAFVSQPNAVYVAAARSAVMLAASADSGVNAGAILKPVLQKHGGRGGGSAAMAQGSVGDTAAVLQEIEAAVV
jgi:alanyl-tRNA synthetase